MQLVHNEVDLLRAGASDRRRSVDARASFLAVAAGIVITASASSQWRTAGWFAVIPLALATIALALAAIASRPERRTELSATRISDRYLDSEQSPSVIERSILESKVAAIQQQDTALSVRGNFISVGFVFLIASALTLTTVYAINLT
ncbi:hypothetical protein [Curtobacterium flaccumfaciens]|uniref:hypothetical protein n=1 Tax=Curtobacterium flaccumfaciens TaxID=2035 RepID=UPI003994FD26